MLIATAFVVGLGGCAMSSKTAVTLDYYQVGGTTLQQIDQEIKDKGPKINGAEYAVAVANISMTPDISFFPTATGCIVKRARIKVRATVVLPRWKNRRNANEKLARTWDNLDRYTRLHEAVHVTIADKHAKLIEKKLLSLQSGRSCEKTGKIAKKIIARGMAKHEREQTAFDASEKAKFSRLANSIKPS